MKIGNKEIKGYAALAPMAGVADRAMREICVMHGASYTVGELASARGITLGDEHSKEYLVCPDKARPAGSQLFGNEPQIMAEAAKAALMYQPDFIDINMGCPAPKVASSGGGSALMADIDLAASIVEAVVKVSAVPVTVKMRTGTDSDNINAPKLAKLCEEAGASAITVHGRTRRQMYAPPVDYETIKAVKETVKIPVIGNGDITDGRSAREMYEKTGCDFVLVGRAARGNPFVFDEINAYFSGKSYTPPTLEEKLNEFKKQVLLMLRYKEKKVALLESRKHAAWYINGIRNAAALRVKCGEISSFEDIERICEKALEQNADM